MIAISYAKALYELQTPETDIYEAERILKENPSLAEVLANPVVSADEKHRAADAIFPESVRSFVKVVCDNQSARYFNEIFSSYREYSDKKKKILHAKMRYVTPPDEKQLEGIKALLCKKHNMNEVEIEMTEDKSLIGGFVITVGDKEYDRSIRGRLKGLQTQLIRR